VAEGPQHPDDPPVLAPAVDRVAHHQHAAPPIDAEITQPLGQDVVIVEQQPGSGETGPVDVLGSSDVLAVEVLSWPGVEQRGSRCEQRARLLCCYDPVAARLVVRPSGAVTEVQHPESESSRSSVPGLIR
jgi:hypothetical protein